MLEDHFTHTDKRIIIITLLFHFTIFIPYHLNYVVIETNWNIYAREYVAENYKIEMHVIRKTRLKSLIQWAPIYHFPNGAHLMGVRISREAIP